MPGYDPFVDAEAFHFDLEAAWLAIDFFAEQLQHIKGPMAGEPFRLEPWQQAIIGNLFGWKRKDGTRRYRECLIFVPRKNGKSLLAAGISNYMLFCDGEPGAEIYCAAAERDQAALVFDVAKAQVLRSPEMSSRAKVYQKAIVIESKASSFRAISADASTKHGYNTHCVIVDELHAQAKPDLVDVLVTSTGARRQPMVVYITTSDYERESICNQKYDYACKVRDGVIDDPSFLPVIYEATRDDDWQSPEVWHKANPNLGISVDEEYFERQAKQAIEQPWYENTFKRLHLNIRTEQETRWFGVHEWDRGVGEVGPGKLAEHLALKNSTCYAGLDLASTSDLSAFVLLFPRPGGTYACLPHFWIPEERAAQNEKRDRVPYSVWRRQGFVDFTPGNVTDYDVIRRRINALGGEYKIKEIAIDRWNATQISTQLQEDGMEVIAFGQGFASMSAPSKELEKLVLSGGLTHGGNPVLRWMASNVAVKVDEAGNVKPIRPKGSAKIDGIVAIIMALGRAMLCLEKKSVYSTRGLRSL